MHTSLRHLLAVSSFLLATAIHAAPLSYTNVDVGIVSTELNNTSLDGDGVLVRGSLAVHPSYFLLASVSDIGYDDDVDGFAWTIGVGGHMPINKQLDLVGRLAYVQQDLDNRGGSNNESGYLVSGTVRGFVMDKLELEGGVQHVHLDDSGSNTSLIGEGRYFLTDRIAGGVLVQLGDSSDFGVNVRFSFYGPDKEKTGACF
jgi:hypothetical protein